MNRGLKRPSLPCLCPNAGPRRTFAFTWGGGGCMATEGRKSQHVTTQTIHKLYAHALAP